MAYTFVNSQSETYYLHSYQAKLKGGKVYNNFFFAKSISPKGTPLDELPVHRNRVIENTRTHLPVLARSLEDVMPAVAPLAVASV